MNKVFINENDIVEIRVIGDQNEASVNEMANQAKALLIELKSQGKPKLILDDITNLGQTDTEARKAVGHAASTLDYDRTAMLGHGGILMRYGTNLMIQAIGKRDKLRYFEDRKEAVDWLLSSL